tara:strand:- start:10953 stop:11783 length:831 start_codon:yes stop_codon:yes gene_type:complete
MNYFRHLLSATIIVNVLFISNAHALVVDFENYGRNDDGSGGIGLLDVFLRTNIDLNQANSTHRLIGQSFGNTGGITFSGGVLLEDPLDSNAMPIAGDGGSVYYGTAFSPETSITTSNYTNTLTIDITSAEMVTSVSGSFVHGLDTRVVGANELVDYIVSYSFDGVADPFLQPLGGFVFNDGADVISFNLDTNTLAGAAMGAFINKVELIAPGYDFMADGNPREEIFEWDFLLSSVSFNEAASPVPVPAALPLFVSALLGGFVAARQRKPSDRKISA